MGKPHGDKLRNSRNSISLFSYFLTVFWDALTTPQKGLVIMFVGSSVCQVGTCESIWHEYYQYSLKCYLTSAWITILGTVHNQCHKKCMACQVRMWVLIKGLIQNFVMQRGTDLVCDDLKLSIKQLWSKRFIRKRSMQNKVKKYNVSQF